MTYLTEYIKQKKKEEEEQRKLSGLPAPLRKQTTYSPPALANRNDNTYYDDPKQTKGSLGMWEDAAWAVPSLLYHGVNSALMGAPDYISKAVNDGWTPFDIEEAGTWEKVGGIVGEAAGFLAPMMGIGKVLSLLMRQVPLWLGLVQKYVRLMLFQEQVVVTLVRKLLKKS